MGKKRYGRGGGVKFHFYKGRERGGAEKVLAMLKWRGGGGAKRFHPLKGRYEKCYPV